MEQLLQEGSRSSQAGTRHTMRYSGQRVELDSRPGRTHPAGEEGLE